MPTIKELSTALNCPLRGDPATVIEGVASLENAGPHDMAAIEKEKYLRLAEESRAGAFLVSETLGAGFDRPCLFTDFPLANLNLVIEALGLHVRQPPAGTHPTAIIDPEAKVGEGCSIGPYAVISAGAVLGDRCVLHPHVVIDGDVIAGNGCVFEAGAMVHDGARLGHRVRIGAHAVISRQGFGFAPSPKGPVQLHHVGHVVLGDDVRIGASTTIDRARFDETRIGAMCGFDFGVHLGHNCTIGERTFLAAQVGLAGNAHLGSDCEVGGQVGIANECGLGDRCRVAAKSGLMRMWGDDLTLFGFPAYELRESMRMLSALRKLGGRRK